MKRMTWAAVTVVALFLLLTAGATSASAQDTFTFTSCELSGGCGTNTSFGTVTLTTNGTGVNVDVVLTSGNFLIETGAGADQWFLFNDTVSGSTVTNITATVNGTTESVLGGLTGATNTTFHADGTGDLTAGISCTTTSSCNGGSGTSLTGGGTADINDLHFTVTNATLAQLETANSMGNIFVADILNGATGGSGFTGDVNVSTPSVPDGGMTLMLLGGALVGLEALRRRVRA